MYVCLYRTVRCTYIQVCTICTICIICTVCTVCTIVPLPALGGYLAVLPRHVSSSPSSFPPLSLLSPSSFPPPSTTNTEPSIITSISSIKSRIANHRAPAPAIWIGTLFNPAQPWRIMKNGRFLMLLGTTGYEPSWIRHGDLMLAWGRRCLGAWVLDLLPSSKVAALDLLPSLSPG
jgi:hypothetical protein